MEQTKLKAVELLHERYRLKLQLFIGSAMAVGIALTTITQNPIFVAIAIVFSTIEYYTDTWWLEKIENFLINFKEP